MNTLYLDQRELSLKLEGGAIAVFHAGKRRGTVPVHLLDRVVMRTAVTLPSSLLAHLADAGVGVILFGGRRGAKHAQLLGRGHNEAARRIGQYRLHGDRAWRQRWSALLTMRKLQGQLRLLGQAAERRPDLRHPLIVAIRRLRDLRPEIAAHPPVDRLLGLEGSAAAEYFAAYTRLFPPGLEFKGRNRRPPRDPVNAALSLAYTLLHSEAIQACHGAGLDPLIGFYHELVFNRESLASDLIEPLRPRVDRWVWEQFRDRHLRHEHFTREGNACLLNKNGRKPFFGAWYAQAKPYQRLLRRYANQLAHYAADHAGEPTPEEDR